MSELLSFYRRLEALENSYDEVTHKLTQPEVLQNSSELARLSKMHSEMEPLAGGYRELKRLLEEIKTVSELAEGDEGEMKALAREELDSLERKKEEKEKALLALFEKPSPDEGISSIILEVRAGTGGEEASLFAADLLRMYLKFALKNNWKTELIDESVTGLKGIKEAAVSISGTGAYAKLKYESGTHRVQRIPLTETSGRIHTSAATVAVLPEPKKDVDVQIRTEDLKIDVFRASGAGGQHVNKTNSAVRITHLPTGVVISCQDERSQHQNKEKAMRFLRARLYEQEKRMQAEKLASARKQQVGSGDRSEKIRTYNFPQDRVTDHRINLTVHHMESILDGNLDTIIDALAKKEKDESLKNDYDIASGG